MANFIDIQILASASFTGDAPLLELLLDDEVVSSSSVRGETGFGSSALTFRFQVDLNDISSLSFRFNDSSPETGRTITIQSIVVNDNSVNPVLLALGAGSSTNGSNQIVLTQGSNTDLADSNLTDLLPPPELPGPANFISGTAGNDTLFGSAADETIDGLAGDDRLYGRAGNDTLIGGDGIDRLFGEDGDDILNGDAGNDFLYGQDGNDTLNGGDGDDRVLGGTGNDTLNGGAGNDLVYGEDGDDQLNGNEGIDRLFGRNGNDTLDGGADNDFLYGDAGIDNLDGGDGDDRLFGGTEGDVLVGGLGNDFLYGEDGNDTLNGDDGIDRLFGGAGADQIDGGAGNDYAYGGDGIDNIVGGAGIDRLFGDDGDDIIDGGEDNDFLYGGVGNDTIDGGNGNDTARGGDGNDTLNGGAGVDRLIGEGGDDVINGGDDTDILSGQEGNDTLNGDAGNDFLYGQEGNDTLNGGDGIDFLAGNDGIDNLSGGEGNDRLQGGDGNDILNGDGGTDRLIGGDGGDDIFGGDGNDFLYALELVSNPAIQVLSNQIQNSDPVAYFRLGETAGTTAANEGSGGSAINATYTGGVTLGGEALYTTGGPSASFDGVNDIVNVPDSDLINLLTYPQRTVELVFNANTTAGRQVLYEEGATVNGLTIYVDDGTIRITGSDDGNYEDVDFNAPIIAGQTYHVAFAFDQPANSFTGYLDGVAIGTVGVGNQVFPSHSGDIGIGGAPDGVQFHDGESTTGGFYFNGSISDVAIYNTALSAGELLNRVSGINLVADPQANDGLDQLYGGAGNDVLYASGGNDQLFGEGDNDTLYGGTGRNILEGGDGNDIIFADGVQIDASGPPPVSTTDLDALILADNPGVFFQLDETSGTTADNLGSGGSAVDAIYAGGVTLGAAALYAGGGLAADFDGVDDIINVPDSALINSATYSEKTVELVFNADTTVGRQVLYEEGGATHGFTIEILDGTLHITGEHDGVFADVDFSSAVTAGQTYHVAFVFDQPNDSFTGYLDGVNLGSISVGGLDFPSHTGNIGIGGAPDSVQFHDGESDSGGFYFDGQISDVAIYTTALSDGAIAARADVVNGTSLFVPAVDDTITGGDGFDQLYGGSGRDIFVFEAVTAFNNVDEINDFDYFDGDSLDISDILTNWTDGHPQRGDIDNYIQFTEVSGNTVISVDADGNSGGNNFLDIAQINGLTGFDANILYDNGQIITI